MQAHARIVRIGAADPVAKLFEFPATPGIYTEYTFTQCECGSDIFSKCTAKLGDHMRLLSFRRNITLKPWS